LTAPVAVVGGGPAGLAAAEVLSDAGVAVHLYDAMPSVGRASLCVRLSPPLPASRNLRPTDGMPS
jgi:flavin-dependent dehydrogenase